MKNRTLGTKPMRRWIGMLVVLGIIALLSLSLVITHAADDGAVGDVDDGAVLNLDDGAVDDVDDGAVDDVDDGAVDDVDDGAVNDGQNGDGEH